MRKDCIFVEDSKIIDHQHYDDDIGILRLESLKCSESALPGSFIHLKCNEELLMRRPFSIMKTKKGEWIEVLYKSLGLGTQALENLKKGDQISLLGLSFKPNTDDVRDSTSLKIAKLLQDQGVIIKSYDPEAMDNAKKENTELQLCNSAYEACVDTKAIIIGTEWNEFRALDFLKIRGSSKNLVIFDLRNIYNAKEITDLAYI